ncbi:MAG: TonB-dependent receptor, partial [Acidobacteria bacterium]|nr:TonB-dependent receptor [Acidobacteriota bacterium]
DSTVGVFQLATREGNRVKPSGRVSAGLLSTSAVFDGPLASGRGGWLVSARKSYLGYVLDRIEAARDEAEGLAIDFTDLQARASYDPGSRHKLGVGAVWSISDFDRSRVRNQLRAGDIMTSRSLIWLLQADWAYTPHSRFAARTRLFGLIGDFDNQNPAGVALDRGARTQAGVRSDVGAAPFARHNLEAGAYVRFLRGTGKEISLSASVPPQPTTLADYGRTAGHQGYYLQDTWSSPRLRFSVTGGLRIDHGALTRQTVVSPRAALGFSPWNGAALRLGWGRHAQFPEFAELFGARGNPNLRAEKAVHYNFSFEQMIGQTARLAAEAYYRAEQGLLFSLNDRYIRDGKLAFVSFPFRNSLHGLARGVEISLHRRSANRLVGWLAYSYSMTHLKDDPTGWSFVSNFDQRHNFSAFGSYRMSETLSLSASCRVGSGLPMVGFYRLAGSAYVTASERNRERLPRYSRTDVRVSKAFLLRRSKLTLAAEVLNLLGHDNFRQDGRRLEKMLPFLPSVSLALEF